MVVTQIVGGLGNQMFQYAAGRALSHKLGTQLVLDVSAYQTYVLHAFGLSHFNIDARIENGQAPANGLLARLQRKLGLKRDPSVLREAGLEFDPRFFEQRDGVRLEGYWQSERYFADIEQQLRRDFSLPPCDDEENRSWLARIAADDGAVSVHVRRGDYVSDKKANSVHGICTLDYYERALALLGERLGGNMRLYVFSDDAQWTAQNLKAPFETFYISHNGPEKNYEDLRLMSACRHHVIANSSFSWWGAWLNARKDKLVVAPSNWFQVAHLSSRDLVPASWIRL